MQVDVHGWRWAKSIAIVSRFYETPPLKPSPISLCGCDWITGNNLLHRFADLLRVGFRVADNRSPYPAEDKLPRVRIDEIKNERAFVILRNVGVRHRSAGPHAVISVSVRPATVIAVAPVGVFLHRDYPMDKDMARNVEISGLGRRFSQAARAEFRAQRVMQSRFRRPPTLFVRLSAAPNVYVLYFAKWADGSWLVDTVTLVVSHDTRRQRTLTTDSRMEIVFIIIFEICLSLEGCSLGRKTSMRLWSYPSVPARRAGIFIRPARRVPARVR